MNIRKHELIQKDGHKTVLCQHLIDGAKASVLLLHGMAEYKERYQAFSEALMNAGYNFYTYDHRGHGTHLHPKELGFIAEKDGYKYLIGDALTAVHYIKHNNPGKPFFLMGHSMGSLIARNVMTIEDNIDGVLIYSTTYPPEPVVAAGLTLSDFLVKIQGSKHISPFLNRSIFGNRLYRELSIITSFDWLSRDPEQVSLYVEHTHCGFTCTTSFYHDLLMLTKRAKTPKIMERTRKDLPIRIVSGSKDPVGGYGKEIEKLANWYQQHNYTRLSFQLYPDCRHELLNESNRDDITADLIQWLNQTLLS